MRVVLATMAFSAVVSGQYSGPTKLDMSRVDTSTVITSTPYAISASDDGRLLMLSNSGPFVATIGQAGANGLTAPWFVDVACLGALCTIHPTGSTINGLTTYSLSSGQQVRLSVFGTNYVTLGPSNAATAWNDDGTTLTTSRRLNIGGVTLSAYSDPASDGHNLFLGDSAGNTTMSPGGNASYFSGYNTAAGYQVLNANATGHSNSGFGAYALSANTGGQYNNAFGVLALRNNTTGNFNSAFGANTLTANTTGYYNQAFGHGALFHNTTGYNNSAFGIDSTGWNTTGIRNAAFGVDSLGWSITGNQNTAMGMNGLWSNLSGSDNTAVGMDALFANTTGNNSIGVGSGAGFMVPNTGSMTLTSTSGSANLSIGWYYYKVTFVLNATESALSEDSYKGVATDASHLEVTLANIPAYSGPLTCTARNVYRTLVGGPNTTTSRNYFLVATINDNTTGTYVDRTPDSSLSTVDNAPGGIIAIGYWAKAYKSQQAVIGSASAPISELWLNGPYNQTIGGNTYPVRISSMGASGTDVAGADLTISGGPGTGAAAGGSIVLATSSPGASGNTWNNIVERWRIDSTGLRSGGTTFTSAGGTIQNTASGGSTQLIIQNGPGQAASGTGSLLWQNFAGSNTAFINWDGGYTVGDGTKYKINLASPAATFATDGYLQWKDSDNVFSGSADTAIYRSAPGVIEINSGTVNSGGGLKIPALKSATGTRFVCVDTTGTLFSSPTPCSGT